MLQKRHMMQSTRLVETGTQQQAWHKELMWPGRSGVRGRGYLGKHRLHWQGWNLCPERHSRTGTATPSRECPQNRAAGTGAGHLADVAGTGPEADGPPGGS